jgi:transposase
MHLRGQTTTFQTRLEISEDSAAGLNDTQIAKAVGCSVWTVRKWRRRSLKLGRVGLTSHMGRPATGPVSTFPDELKETILHLRKLHPGWGPNTLLAARKHGCTLARSTSAESSTHSNAAQTGWSDAPRSSPS